MGVYPLLIKKPNQVLIQTHTLLCKGPKEPWFKASGVVYMCVCVCGGGGGGGEGYPQAPH